MRTQSTQPKIKKMATSTFVNLPEVFCQRNTSQRVSKVAKRLATNPLPTHKMVSIGEYPDGKQVILDGNTRRLAWDINPRLQPEYVIATIYSVAGDLEAKNIYEALDSPDAVEKGADKMYSAMRMVFTEEEMDAFQSKTIGQGRFTSGLRYAVSKLLDKRPFPSKTGLVGYTKDIQNYADYIQYYKEELKVLDSLLVPKTRGEIKIIAAKFTTALILLKKYGTDNEKVLNGLERFISNDFTPAVETNGFGKIDAVCWINRYLETDPLFATLKGTNGEQMPKLLNYYLSIFERWMNDVTMANNSMARKPNDEGYYNTYFAKNNFAALYGCNNQVSLQNVLAL